MSDSVSTVHHGVRFLGDYQNGKWVESANCDKCGTSVSRYSIGPGESLWFELSGQEHTEASCNQRRQARAHE